MDVFERFVLEPSSVVVVAAPDASSISSSRMLPSSFSSVWLGASGVVQSTRKAKPSAILGSGFESLMRQGEKR